MKSSEFLPALPTRPLPGSPSGLTRRREGVYSVDPQLIRILLRPRPLSVVLNSLDCPAPKYLLFRPLFSRFFYIITRQWGALSPLVLSQILSHPNQGKMGPEIMLLVCMESEGQDHSSVYYICFGKRFLFTQYWVKCSKACPRFSPSIFSSKSVHCCLYDL